MRPFESDMHIDDSELTTLVATVAGKADSSIVTAVVATVAGKADSSTLTSLTSTVSDKLTSSFCRQGDDSTVAARLYKAVITSQRSTPDERGDASVNHTSAATNLAQTSYYSDLPGEFYGDDNNWRVYENWSTTTAVISAEAVVSLLNLMASG